ncbi:MAG: DUF4835 family protein [Bacteroides sp.]|nr:DUF4835 family protein [Bacteroides sp.]MDE6248758.1 DUF4835 family protein [Paramuribaculum sp.]
MTRILSILALLMLLWPVGKAGAQELNCTVEVNSSLVEGTNTSLFETLQEAISEYMNTTKFTNAQFSPNEKIECRLFFTIGSVENDVLSGDLQVQSTRPVYNSSYTTTMLNFKDSGIEFSYQQGEPLIFNETSMESNLTAILNFYAYLFLALDFDSFSPRGGQPYFDRLATIVQQAQSSGEKGWRAFEDTKNRSAVLSAYTDGSTSVLRDLNYQYHRKGLDEMSVSPDKGRNNITKNLEALTTVYSAQPMSVGLSMFKDAKLDELVNVYSKSQQVERDQVYKLLRDIYPTEQTRLNKIRVPADTK